MKPPGVRTDPDDPVSAASRSCDGPDLVLEPFPVFGQDADPALLLVDVE